MSTWSKNYTTILAKAKHVVPGFAQAYALFLEPVRIYRLHSSAENTSKKIFYLERALKN